MDLRITKMLNVKIGDGSKEVNASEQLETLLMSAEHPGRFTEF